MAFGIKGWFKILVCSLLSLLYYIPGLVYALLITSHLGLGRKITAKDCGGLVNMGLRLAGCTSIKTETDCEGATIPGWRDANGDRIRSCYFVKNDNEQFGGKCYNIIYPSAIHTTGSKYRYASEVGGASHVDTLRTILPLTILVNLVTRVSVEMTIIMKCQLTMMLREMLDTNKYRSISPILNFPDPKVEPTALNQALPIPDGP